MQLHNAFYATYYRSIFFPSSELNDHVLISGNRQLSATSGVAVPVLIRDAGADTIRRFVEFFTANIRNHHQGVSTVTAETWHYLDRVISP